MSRPFSYNDENFTVIGNMLIIHCKIPDELPLNSLITIVPPEILSRMTCQSFCALVQSTRSDIRKSITTPITVIKNELRNYNNISIEDGIMFAFTSIKVD
jgi:hypothetical protein|nr:MAG TPA: hypothetical protein [Caudoviricetes sp.]